MAEVYKNIPGTGGGKIEKAIALHKGVQDFLDVTIFTAGLRAEEMLLQHRQEGHAQIEIEQGDVDRYLILSDERGQRAAMSIEYGREGGEDDDDYSAMEGLFILHKALRIKPGRKK